MATKPFTVDGNIVVDEATLSNSTSSIVLPAGSTITGGGAVLDATNSDTDDLAEGTTNLYFTDARADARIALQAGANLDLSSKSTTDLSEGTNLYYTDTRVRSAVSATTGSAGYDSATGTFSIPANTTQVTEGTNLYYTDTRADARIALQAGANLDLSSKSTTDLSEGTNLYYTDTRADARIALQAGANLDLSSKSTTDLSEGTNLYYTDTRADTRADARIAAASITDLSDADQSVQTTDNVTFANITATGYIAGPATFTIDPAAVGDNTGTVVIAGDLQVDGTTTTINSTTLEVEDKNVVLGPNAANDAANNGAGLTVTQPDTSDASLIYNTTDTQWELNKKLDVTGKVTSTDIDILSNNPRIRLDDSDTDNNAEVTLDNTSLRIEVDEDNAIADSLIKFRVDADTKAVITSDGRLGIGYDSPADNIHILGSNASPNVGITLQSDDTANATAAISLFARDASNVNKISEIKNVAGQLFIERSDAGTDVLALKSTGAGAGGPQLDFYHHSASPADNDVVGTVNFNGWDDASNATTFARVSGVASDVTNGVEKGDLVFSTRRNGSTFDEKFRIAHEGYLVAQSASQVRLVLGSEGTYNNNTSNWIRGSGTGLGFNTAGGDYNFEVNGGNRLALTSGGNLLLNQNTILGRNTADGSDTGYLAVVGGGAESDGRGAIIRYYGNEHATNPGRLSLGGGNVTNADITFRASGVNLGRMDPDNDLHSMALSRYVGSSGNLLLEGDDTVVGMPGIQFKNTADSLNVKLLYRNEEGVEIRSTLENDSGVGNDLLTLANTRVNTGSSAAGIKFVTNEISGSSQYVRAKITAEYDDSSNLNGRLLFSTSDSSGNIQNRVTITGSGTVSIEPEHGETSSGVSGAAGGSLDLNGGTAFAGRLLFTGYNDNGTNLIGFNNESNGLVLYDYTDTQYIMRTNNDQKVSFGGGFPNVSGSSTRVYNVIVDDGICIGDGGYTHGYVGTNGTDGDVYIAANAYPANLGADRNVIIATGSPGGGGPNEVVRYNQTDGVRRRYSANTGNNRKWWSTTNTNFGEVYEYDYGNKLYFKKTRAVGGYAQCILINRYMPNQYDVSFELKSGDDTNNNPYRHFGIALNHVGTENTSQFDYVVFRQRYGNSALNQIRIDQPGGTVGTSEGSSIPNFHDETKRKVMIQKRASTLRIQVHELNSTVYTYGTITGINWTNSSGYFGFSIYESTNSKTWAEISNLTFTDVIA